MSSLQTCRWRGRPAQSYRHAECSGASRLDLRGCCARKRLQYSIVKDPWAVFPSTFRRERPVPGATFRHFFRFECKSCQADKRVTQPLGMPLSHCGPWPNRRSQKVENRLYSHWTNARAPAKEDQTQAPHGAGQMSNPAQADCQSAAGFQPAPQHSRAATDWPAGISRSGTRPARKPAAGRIACPTHSAKILRSSSTSYAVRIDSDLSEPLMAAWAAARRAIGTR